MRRPFLQKREVIQPRPRFLLEPLEPRLMLSADLFGQFGALTLPDPAVSGDKLTVPAIFTNGGDTQPNRSIKINIHASADPMLDNHDPLVVSPTTQSITKYLEPHVLLSSDSPEETASQAQALRLFSATPALFIENVGQIDNPTVRYAFYGDGANVYHTTQGPVYQLSKPGEAVGQGSDSIESFTISASFVGAEKVEPVGFDLMETRVNYYIGSNPEDWHTDVPAYTTVVYPALYQGIDLYTFGRRDSLKYEFHVAPGADPSTIAIHYENIQGLSLDESGALHVMTSLGELVDDAPIIYQESDGVRTEISGEFVLLDHSTYTVAVTGNYDSSLPLVIDPDLAWAAFMGGDYNDDAHGIAVDRDGNVLVAGGTLSSGFPVKNGFGPQIHKNSEDAFVTKIKADGSEILWSSFLGGSSDETAMAIAVDKQGNAIVTGSTFSDDFPTPRADFGPGFHRDPQEDQSEDQLEVFVTKISRDGQIVWSGYLGGTQSDAGKGIAVDAAGDVVVTGGTWSDNFQTKGGLDATYHGAPVPPPPAPGQPAGSTEGIGDAFVTKIKADGSEILWSGYLGGSMRDSGKAVAVDWQGDVLVTGYTRSDNFNMRSGRGFDTSFNGAGAFIDRYEGGDAFVTKIKGDGSEIVWSSYLGGADIDGGHGIAADGNGDVFVTGYTFSNPFPTKGSTGTSFNGGDFDVFVTKIKGDGSDKIWSRYLGGSDNERSWGIALDRLGNPVVVGITGSNNFPTTNGFQTTYSQHVFGQYFEAFVTKLDTTGQIIWSSYLGASADDTAHAVAVFGSTVFVAGSTWSPNFPARNSFDTSYGGPGPDEWGAYYAGDAFVARINDLADWTILFYNNGDNDLESDGDSVLAQIESVDLTHVPNGNIKLLMQLDRNVNEVSTMDKEGNSAHYDKWPIPDWGDDWHDTRRGQVAYNSNRHVDFASSLSVVDPDYPELNMGDPATLSNFLQWGTTFAPANHYMLIMLSHGGGWIGSQWDDDNGAGGIDALYTWELRQALSAVPKIDVVVMDMCLMQMVEVATELVGKVDYLYGSEVQRNVGSLDYVSYLKELKQTPQATPGYAAALLPLHDKMTTKALVETSQVPNLNTALNAFTTEVINSASASDREHLKTAIASADTFYDSLFRDLRQYMSAVYDDNAISSAIHQKAGAVIVAVAKAARYAGKLEGYDYGGMSIYLPSDAAAIRADYTAEYLTFADPAKQYGTRWGDFLRKILGAPDPVRPSEDLSGTSSGAQVLPGASPGQPMLLESRIENGSDTDVIKVNATAGEVLDATVIGGENSDGQPLAANNPIRQAEPAAGAPSGRLVPVLTVYGLDGTTVLRQVSGDSAGNASLGLLTLPQSGNYYLAVSSSGSTSGPYTLSFKYDSASAMRPQLTVSSPNVQFGEVKVGISGEAKLRLTNSGGSPLVITGLSLSAGSGFVARSVPIHMPITISPHSLVDLPLGVTPTVLGPMTDTLHVLSNDPAQPDLSVPLAATATEPLSNYDQYLLELINRARANPSAESALYGIDLNEGVPADKTISADPKQPLAPNLHLISAAQGHSQWMMDNDTFSHTGANGTNPGQRMSAAGYSFLPPWSRGENIDLHREALTVPALTPTTAGLHQDLFVDSGYAGRGHRINLLNPNFKEVGTGVKTGDWGGSNAVDGTEDFAYTAGNSFLTGVAYNDKLVTDDDFYTPGEGLSGVTVTATRAADGAAFTTTTWSSGGYTLQLPAGTYMVAGSGGGISSPITYSNVTIADQNIKRDFILETATPLVAEIVVEGLSSQNIADGDTTSNSADGTDFGSVVQASTGPTRTFTVRNTGTAALTLGTLATPTGFIVSEPLNASIAPRSSDTFTLQLSTTNAGTFAGDISFSTNDGDGGDGVENPFNFTITGTVTLAAGDDHANAGQWGSATSISISSSTGDGTGTGSIGMGDDTDLFKFVAAGTGSATITASPSTSLDAIIKVYDSGQTQIASVDQGRAGVSEQATISVTAGQTYYMLVGSYQATTGTYTLNVEGPPSSVPVAEIVVEGLSNQNISDGDATPNSADGTDFGLVVQAAAGPTRTFTVRNTGTAALTLGTLATPTGFIVSEPLNASIAPGSSDTFTLRLSTTNAGTFAGDISFSTNDGDGGDGVENPFNFRITGMVTSSGATGDAYEPDDSAAQASTIATNGIPQTHSIHAGADVDWVMFTLSQTSNVSIETDGSTGDTEIILSGPDNPATFIEYDDDDGDGSFSRIVRSGANALAPGTYYVAVNEYNNDNTIPSYTIAVTDTDRDGRARLVYIEISNTTASSSLSFTTKEPTGQLADAIGVSIETITGSSPLGKLTGKAVDLVGEGIHLTGDGYIASIQLRNVKNGADILMPGKGAPKGVTIKAGRIDDGSQMTLGSGLASLTATEWLDGSLQAPWATKISVAEDFGADLLLDGTGNPKQTLGNLTVKGDARQGLWKIEGLVGTVVVTGMLDEINLQATGTITTVTAGGARKSWIFAGVKDGVQGLPASRGDFADPGVEIKNLTIKGILVDTRIAAPMLGKVRLQEIEPNNGGNAFGIAADRIKSYARTGIRPLSNLDLPGEADKAGDYVVRLL